MGAVGRVRPVGSVRGHRSGRATSALRRAASALVLVVAAACASPTLPLPPPDAPSITTGAETGTFLLTSEHGASPGALILAINRNESLPPAQRVAGTFADDDGSWQLQVYAQVGDVLDLSQETPDAKSSTISVTVR